MNVSLLNYFEIRERVKKKEVINVWIDTGMPFIMLTTKSRTSENQVFALAEKGSLHCQQIDWPVYNRYNYFNKSLCQLQCCHYSVYSVEFWEEWGKILAALLLYGDSSSYNTDSVSTRPVVDR